MPIETFQADVTDEKAIQNAFATALRKHGPIDVLVSNAGYLSVHVPISDSPLQDYWQGFETNVKGGLVVAQAFIKVASPNATLINVSSGAAYISYIPGYSGYSASKLAFWRIMDYFQQENPELRVFNLQPRRIESDMSRKAGDTMTGDDIDLPAGMCLWLTTKESDFLRGRFVWANWDVTELIAAAEKIEKQDLFTIDLRGFKNLA